MDPREQNPDLIRRARQGEQGALDALMAPHAADLRLYASHKLGRPLRSGGESAEFLQDVFLAAFANFHEFHGSSAEDLRHWFQKIAEKRVVEGKAGNAPQGLRFQLGPMTMAAVGQEQNRLEQAWGKLPEKMRQVIGLRQLEGLPAAAAAARMGIDEKEINGLYLEAVRRWKDLSNAG